MESMMNYSISQGILSNDGVALLSRCYSGGDCGLRPEAVNNPDMCSVRPNVGPIPPGKYTIGPLEAHPVLGPAMALTPDPANQMFGGSGFYIHYSNARRDAGEAPYRSVPGRNSSDGCIVCTEPSGLQKVETLRAAGNNRLDVDSAPTPLAN